MISSPSKSLIGYVSSELARKRQHKEPMTVGKKHLFIDDIQTLEPRLKPPFTLITGTPIYMRISRKRYLEYDIKPKYPYPYIYWKKEYPLELFIRQMEENLRAKYVEFTGKETIDEPIFQKLTFRKQCDISSLNGFT